MSGIYESANHDLECSLLESAYAQIEEAFSLFLINEFGAPIAVKEFKKLTFNTGLIFSRQ